MKKTYKIKGIKIDKKKVLAASSIAELAVPKVLKISLSQHIGQKAIPIVKLGDVVDDGTLIAKKAEGISANVHSSVYGKIQEITDNYIAVEVIKSKKISKIIDDEILKDITNDKSLILSKIEMAGVVGMGGAGFPTACKLDLCEDDKISTLIVNGMECEPYISADTRLMIERAEEIVIGARVVNRLLGIQNAIIVVDEANVQAYEVLRNITRRYIGVNVKKIKTIYPQGSEKMLIKSLFNQEVSLGKLPKDYGFIVQNVSTICAVYDAVMLDKPLYERVISIAGDGVAKKGNYKVRIGTSISDIMKELGISKEGASYTIINGEMMGDEVVDFNASITKRDTCLLFFSKRLNKPEESPCIRCNECAARCPVYLQPFEIAKDYKLGKVHLLEKLHPEECIRCGICSYVCPAKIPLVDYINSAKTILKEGKVNVK